MTDYEATPDAKKPERVAPTRGVVRGHVVVAVKLLRERIAEPWTLEALAAEVHLSRPQLARCFDAHYGVSPTEYRHRQSAPPID